MKSEIDDSYDLVINLHNVIGFTDNPEKALFEMRRVLKPEGFLVSIIPNKYHALFFNIMLGRFDAINTIVKENKGTFIDNMPQIAMFTPASMRDLYRKIGIKNTRIFGFPITVYPQAEEAKISGTSIPLEKILGNKEIYELLVSVEKKLIAEETASRGNNLFAIGQK